MQAGDLTKKYLILQSKELLTFHTECKIRFHTVDEKGDLNNGHYTVAELIEENSNILTSFQEDSKNFKLRWFHIPANNMSWVEVFMEKWFRKPNCLDEKIWGLKVRPGFSPQTNKPLHSRHMEPSCTMGEDLNPSASRQPGNIQAHELEFNFNSAKQPGKYTKQSDKSKKPLLALYLPYMNWDIYSQFRTLRQSYEHKSSVQLGPRPIPSSTSTNRENTSANGDNKSANRKMMEHSLSRFLEESPPLHPRRTLDQFYYGSLNDTSSRDSDQVISKWTGLGLKDDGREKAEDSSAMIMIDQLWCWVLDNRTVLSCFPSDDFQYSDKDKRFTDIYNGIQKSYNKSKTAWDLFSNIVNEATTYLFRQDNKNFLDLIEIFRWVVSKKAAEQVQFFENFNKTDLRSDSIRNLPELKLVLEVADIIDELKMIRSLADKQREVLKSLILALGDLNPSTTKSDYHDRGQILLTISDNIFERDSQIHTILHQKPSEDSVETTKRLAAKIEGAARDNVVSADETLLLLIAEVDKLTREGENTHKILLNLLELKQTAAALMEARYATEQARATTKQGRVIMLFTIITIIFLPLSFFTSYFGQNISELTGDTSNPTSWELWRYGTPISIIVIASALLIAYRINNPSSRLWFWRPTANSRAQDLTILSRPGSPLQLNPL